MYQDTDIDLILGECGDVFAAGVLTQPCLFTLQDEVVGTNDQFPGQVMAMSYALVRTSAFPDLKEQDVVSVKPYGAVSFTNYRAAKILRIQDGRVSQVFLGAAV
jgi:hypothetical protein